MEFIEIRYKRSRKNLRAFIKIINPPTYFSFGKRYTNILHTKLRHNCLLNNDLCKRNIINSPLCSCGKYEDVYHYFFACTKYANARNNLFNYLFMLEELVTIDTNLLLWGDRDLPVSTNINIFAAVHRFITEICRS